MEEMSQRYEAKETEKKWKEHWEKNNTYAFDKKSDKPVYTIDTPPPTVSGKMHIGHSFSYTHEDIIARFHRMNGKNVFYPFGTDDNGLPTDKLVEKTKGVKSRNMERTEYLKLAMDTVSELLPEFVEDWKKIGMSCDFNQKYSTISPAVQKASQKGFLELIKKGLAYRKDSPVSWCPSCQTAIAQAEFENIELNSHFNDIIFKSGKQDLVIATTRPELLPACVALFYHPEDTRYQQLEGKTAKVPLFDYEVPILADETVALDKGTGLMMCCTFGDKEDIEKWNKHSLPLRAVFNKNGTLNEEGKAYEGLAAKEARKQIITDLKEAKLLLESKSIKHPVNVHERCGTEVEYLHTNQWFINVLEHKEKLVGAADLIKWHPKHMKARYVHWVENLNWDWCISRQRYFGIPLPVWYTKDGAIVLPDESELPVDPTSGYIPKGYKGDTKDLMPETDVFDTWATSSLTPQLALKWVEDEEGFKKKFPMSMRPQAHDIIRTWAFYTITRGIYHEGRVPWENIMVSGFVLDPKGNKMSKSKGNVIAPQDIIDKYSADALRFWAAGSKLGDDLPFMEKDVQTGHKTINKLWNATRFAFMQLEDYDGSKVEKLETSDAWLLSKLQGVIKTSTLAYEEYEYSKAKQLIDNFFWNTFCDNYLEIIKDRMYNPEKRGIDAKKSAQYTLRYALETILKLMAPIMPFITEEIYQHAFAKDGESIHLSEWPKFNETLVNIEAEKAGDLLVQVIGAVRLEKSQAKTSLKTPVMKMTITASNEDQKLMSLIEDDLKSSTISQELSYKEGDFFVIVELGEAPPKPSMK